MRRTAVPRRGDVPGPRRHSAAIAGRGRRRQDARFWQTLDDLVRRHAIVVDRPRGSAHPRYPDFTYPLDYGYLDGTTSGDGAGIDVWRGTLPDAVVTAVLCCVDGVKRDVEIKLLVGCTAAEIVLAASLQDDGDQAAVAISRPGAPGPAPVDAAASDSV